MTRRNRKTPAVRPSVNITEVVQAAADLERYGTNGYSASAIAAAERSGGKFCEWLATFDLTLDGLADTAPRTFGRPVIPASVVTAFMAAYAETSTAKAESLRAITCHVALYLRINGWDTSSCEARTSETGRALKASVKSLRTDEIVVRKQARPIVANDLDLLLDAVETYPGWTDLCRAAMTAYLVTCWSLSLRGGEAACRLTWGMIDLAHGEVRLPGGRVFKKQDDQHILAVPHNHPATDTCGATKHSKRCPHAVLAAWRDTCIAYDIPTGDNALVFPSIRTSTRDTAGVSDQRRAQSTLDKKFGDALFIACPIDTSTPDSTAKTEGNHYDEYRSRYKRLAEQAGVTPDHQWHNGGTHGLRRGSATEAIANGVSPTAVSQRLRHSDTDTTSLYIEPSAPDTTTLFTGITAKDPD